MAEELACRRCRRPVVRNRDWYDVFEGMHWACFHYEFEHLDGGGDPDVACGDLSCPARAFDPAPPPTWRPEEPWVREGRMPEPADIGPVGWANYLVAQAAQALIGLIGPEILGVAVSWSSDEVRLHVAASDANEASREDLHDAVDELTDLLGGRISVSLDLQLDPVGPEWRGYRERRVYERRP